MKLKAIIALALAMLLVATLATPVLAAPPAGAGKLNPQLDIESGRGVYLLRVVGDNDLQLTVILIGAQANTDYDQTLWWSAGAGSWNPGGIKTDDKGNYRGTFVLPNFAIGPVTHTFYLELDRGAILYIGDDVTISF